MSHVRFLLLLLFVSFLLTAELPLAAQDEGPAAPAGAVGSSFVYQGELRQDGNLVGGECDFRFQLWDAASGGNQVGADIWLYNVPVDAGRFTVTLNSAGQFGEDAFNGDARWLWIWPGCPAGGGTFTGLWPRQPLAAAPYAHSLRPGARIATSATALYLEGFQGLEATADYVGVWGESTSDAGYGVVGYAGEGTGTTYGVCGLNGSSSGRGVYGAATSTSGDTEGVLASVDSPGGEAVEAWNTADDDTANIFAGCSLSYCNDIEFLVQRSGNVFADGTFTGGGADYADLLPVSGDPAAYAPGDVLVVGADGRLVLSSAPYQATVVGVYSARPAFLGDPRDDAERRDLAASAAAGEEVARAPAADGLLPVALAGVVSVKVSAENGPIAPGDLLATASVPGHAMRCQGVERCFGRTLGKAMGSLEEGAGVIPVLVMLQ